MIKPRPNCIMSSEKVSELNVQLHFSHKERSSDSFIIQDRKSYVDKREKMGIVKAQVF